MPGIQQANIVPQQLAHDVTVTVWAKLLPPTVDKNRIYRVQTQCTQTAKSYSVENIKMSLRHVMSGMADFCIISISH